MRVYRLAAVACVLLVAGVARADTRNVISRITVTDAGGGAQVRIVGTRAPSFTQFTLERPQRVVIDLSGTVLAGPAAEIPGDGQLIRGIRTAMFESRTVSVARVTLEFAHPVTYGMHAQGTNLVVSVTAAPGTTILADAAPSTRAGSAATRADVTRDQAERRAAQADAALQQAKAALATAQAARKAADARATAEAAQAKAAESARASADAARKAALARLAQASTASAEESAAQADLAKARAAEAAANAARKAAEEKAAEEARARADAEAKATTLAAAQAKAEADAAAARKQAAAAEAEVARLRAQGRVVADATTGVEPGERYALADLQAGGTPEGTGPQVAPGAPKVMELVGFRQKDKVSQVFIRTNAPARYSVNQSDGAVIVDVENTQARTQNDLNFLDTRFFDSAVSRIDPQEIEGAGTHIRIRIELKEKVPFEVKQVGNEIRIDFQRPAG